MKKNLLFIIPSLSAGGGEKSLINLLSQIDYDLYNVDIFLLNHNGLFMEFIPPQVNVLPLPDNYKLFSLSLLKSIYKFLGSKNYKLAINRILYTICIRLNKSVGTNEQYGWKYLSRSLADLAKVYDVSIGFLEKTSIYFCVDRVTAHKKIGWIHNDYDKLESNIAFDEKYFKKLHEILTVSEECATVLKSRFPDQRNKINVIYNIVSPSVINKLSNQMNDVFIRNQGQKIILSVGRLHHQKGFEMAINACEELVKKGNNLKWFVIGEGEERSNLEKLIAQKKLQNHFILLGLKANPYPYIKQCDIYVQTSKFEGKSIALDEAKILCKPIIITNYSTAKDQIKNNINGLIVEMDPSSIAAGIYQLIHNPILKDSLISNLSIENLGTEKEINKLYQLL
ncbi:glycosyltransferase [Jeotgalibacillus campisalis]|uniref:Glycosyl transferase family 1 n=1 Tax=Jeotgalibacillus campisalis TaxID=220754 RepID=A0A0C2SGB6_9BACL|nr:glycosyltransferase [Jeotgalibacillus campisalis]KIL52979.1 glycosyl transferase family 1 [Jeotgalibacillus campisalis]